MGFLVSFGVTVDLLKDVLPVGSTLNAETVRNHLHRTAARVEAELGQERASFIEGFPPIWAKLPISEGPIVVGIDGGYVRARDGTQSHFEVLVSKSEDQENRYFGLIQSHDDKPRRRLHEVLREQDFR